MQLSSCSAAAAAAAERAVAVAATPVAVVQHSRRIKTTKGRLLTSSLGPAVVAGLRGTTVDEIADDDDAVAASSATARGLWFRWRLPGEARRGWYPETNCHFHCCYCGCCTPPFHHRRHRRRKKRRCPGRLPILEEEVTGQPLPAEAAAGLVVMAADDVHAADGGAVDSRRGPVVLAAAADLDVVCYCCCCWRGHGDHLRRRLRSSRSCCCRWDSDDSDNVGFFWIPLPLVSMEDGAVVLVVGDGDT